jgi:hypothetical protein
MTHAPARKRRRWVGPVVILSILVILIVAAFLVAEKLARDAAETAITKPIQDALGTDQKVDVDFGGGFLILQALGGSVDEVTVTASDVAFAGASGDIGLTAAGVPLNIEGTVASLGATVSIDESSIQALVPALSGTGGTVTFENDQLVLTTQADILGQSVPVVIVLVPSAANGMLSFEPVSMTVNGDDVSIDDVRAGAYGPGPAAMLTPPSVCVAELLPASLTLSSAGITGKSLVLGFAGSEVSLAGGGFTTKGSCA